MLMSWPGAPNITITPAGSFVKGIDGCYFNVMGFPLHAFSREVVQLIRDGHLQLSSA